jgi:type II secretory pathway component PulL
MIGFIDWTDQKLNVYLFQKEGNDYELTDTQSVAIEGTPDPSLVSSLVNTNIEELYLSVPPGLLTFRELVFPFSDDKKIHDTISYELEGILLGNINDYSIDCIVRDSSDNETRVLAVCIENTKLKEILDLFLPIGLEPSAVTSLDLRFFSDNINLLVEGSQMDEEMRIDAAREELEALSVNLRQGQLAYKGDIERFKKSLRLTGTLVLLFLFILGAGMIVKMVSLKKENSLVSQEINKIFAGTFQGEQKIVDPLRQFKGNLNMLREKKTILGGIPVLDIIREIANLKNKDIRIRECKLDEQNIVLKGTALSFENVDSFKTALQDSFSEVRVTDSKSSPDRKIVFSIAMKEEKK